MLFFAAHGLYPLVTSNFHISSPRGHVPCPPADFKWQRRNGSRSGCLKACRLAGRSSSRCLRRCDLEEEDIIDLFYKTGGFSNMPEDKDFDFYAFEETEE